MPSLVRTLVPPVALGMTALVLATIGLLLFWLPVLGAPISACALVVGLTGTLAALAGWEVSLRWAVAGSAAAALALVINVAIAQAPAGYWPGQQTRPPMWREPQDRPAVPPPAPPRFGAPTNLP